MVLGNRPTLKHVREFGCDAYVTLPKEQQTAFGAKGWKGILVGFDGETNYKIYNPLTHATIIIHDVKFNEEPIPQIILQTAACKNEEQHELLDDAAAESEKTESNEKDQGSAEQDANDDDDDEEEEKDFFEAYENIADQTTLKIPTPAPSPENQEPAEQVPSSSRQQPDGNNPKQVAVTYTTRNKSGTVTVSAGQAKSIMLGLRPRSHIKPPERLGFEKENKKKNTGAGAMSMLAASENSCVPKTYKQAMLCADKEKWQEAIDAEIKSLVEYGTFDIVDMPDFYVKVLNNMLVFALKTNPAGTIARYKARLVIKGYLQEYGVDFFHTFTNVARLESIRLMLAISVKQSYIAKSLDITTAFLQGELNETIYMKIPDGMEKQTNKVCLLKIPLYGLRQAPYQWVLRLTTFLKTLDLNHLNMNYACTFVTIL